jgi:hypothetical protein
MQRNRHAAGWTCLACIGLVLWTGGCSQTMPDRAVRMTRGYLYYLDGAGGGRPLSNWSGGIKQGMLEAGYSGAGEMFSWNTGLGVVADQDASVAYKRSKAAELASRIQEYRRQQPAAPVTLMGLSAGTALVVFTLEALPADCQADNVVLLSSSISATYDLTQSLRRVRTRMYVFTSEKDGVLALLVPASGTADRQKGVEPAGLRGFQVPSPVSAETRTQYAKISYIGWKPEFELAGNFGGHTDVVKAPFVQEFIAPLVMLSGARTTPVATNGAGGKMSNPDYDRWARFPDGSWATFEGHQLFNGVQRPVRMVAKLVSKHQDKVVVERTYLMLDNQQEPLRVQTFVAAAAIPPADHPLTSSIAKIVALPPEQLQVAGKNLDCTVLSIEANGSFPEWGSDIVSRMYTNRTVPGGIVKVSLKSHRGSEPFEFDGQVVQYGVPDATAAR